jgi:hypothetical protein
MTLTPPFYLTGEAGKALGAVGYQLAALGVQDAVLSLRSLDADTLQFSLRDNGNRPAIPDDGQWLTLTDDSGKVLFTGIAKRSFRFPERIYTYEVSNVYRGLMETPLLGANGRPYITYYSDQLGNILSDILGRAIDAGLPIQAPAQMPETYAVPKMSFRGTTIDSAIVESLKWLPGVSSGMDYSTTPPTLRICTRADASVTVLDLDSEGHKATALELTASSAERAAGISFSYAVRSGDTTVTLATQQAGDPAAAGAARQSVYLTGADRMDAFLGEALVAAIYAKAEVDKLIIAGGGSVADNDPQVPMSWASCLALDTAGGLAGAVAAEPAFVMAPTGGGNFSTGDNWGQYAVGSSVFVAPYNNGISVSSTPLYLADGAGTPVVGWYAVDAGFFTAVELAAVGVTLQVGFIKGDLVRTNSTGAWTAGETYLHTNALNSRRMIQKSNGTRWTRYSVSCPADLINVPPSVALSLLSANNDGFNAKLVTRAGYADIPSDLAQNYFARQDWTPYKGRISMAPSAADFPAPGDFLSVRGEGTPAEWETMKVPVSELSVDLRTGAATVAIGPSPRMDFSSLVDRLRIPPEDNYQPG